MKPNLAESIGIWTVAGEDSMLLARPRDRSLFYTAYHVPEYKNQR